MFPGAAENGGATTGGATTARRGSFFTVIYIPARRLAERHGLGPLLRGISRHLLLQQAPVECACLHHVYYRGCLARYPRHIASRCRVVTRQRRAPSVVMASSRLASSFFLATCPRLPRCQPPAIQFQTPLVQMCGCVRVYADVFVQCNMLSRYRHVVDPGFNRTRAGQRWTCCSWAWGTVGGPWR